MKRFFTLLMALMLMFMLTVSASSSKSPAKSTEPQKVKVNTSMQDLGRSVTDFPSNLTSARLDDFVALGVKAMRMDAQFHSPSEGVWEIPDHTVNMMKMAHEKGILIKLIPQTIKDPPDWMVADENTRMKDNNGRLSKYVISYWYDGLREYSEKTLRAKLEELKKHDLLHTIGSINMDLGVWGEPTYPVSFTQTDFGNDGPAGEEVLWCYGDNAIADFRVKMEEKYKTINAANKAWGTSYKNFATISPPKPNTVTGQLWEDTLTWYIKSKDDFIEWQVAMFRRVVNEYYENMPLISPMASYYTQNDWDNSVKTGTMASFGIYTGSDLDFIIDLAYKHGCIIQYGGLPDISPIAHALTYMQKTGKTVPLIGENGGFLDGINDPDFLIDLVIKYGLAGLDFTHARLLYKDDGVTKSKHYYTLKENMPRLEKYLRNPVATWKPPIPKPLGDILRYDVTFDKLRLGDPAWTNTKIAALNYTIAKGDVLEYDVKLSANVAGLGAIDGMIGGKYMREDWLIDTHGISGHPTGDITEYAYGKWHRRELVLDRTQLYADRTGKKLTEIYLGMGLNDTEINSKDFSNTKVTIWYDNIRITNNGKVKLVIFESARNVDLSKAELVSWKNATAKVSIVNVSDAK